MQLYTCNQLYFTAYLKLNINSTGHRKCYKYDTLPGYSKATEEDLN